MKHAHYCDSRGRTVLVHTGGMSSAIKTGRHDIRAKKRKQQKFFELAERFRNTKNPKEAKRLGDELGRMIFGA